MPALAHVYTLVILLFVWHLLPGSRSCWGSDQCIQRWTSLSLAICSVCFKVVVALCISMHVACQARQGVFIVMALGLLTVCCEISG